MFRYIGGKHVIGKWIFNNMPKVKWNKYSEVFGGAMWLYLKNDINAKHVYYNDINKFLYNLWYCICYNRDYIKSVIDSFPKDNLNNREKFYEYRDIIQNDNINIEYPNFDYAIAMIYVLTHSFSGNIVNCGCGFEKSQSIRSWNIFRRKLDDSYYNSKINRITPMNYDFEYLIDLNDIKGGFFYVDPPYWNLEHLYYTKNFPKEKHFKLAEKLRLCKSSWILSYYKYDNLEEMYPKKDYIWLTKKFSKSSTYKPHEKFKIKEDELIIYPKSLEKIKNKRIGVFFNND